MGNVIAIGLTPSRTGIVNGRLLNAQLRHVFDWLWVCALRGGINNLYFGHRHAVGKLHNTVWFYNSLEFSLSFSFAFIYLINARAHFAFTFISGQFLIYNLQRHIFCNKHGTLINKTNKNTPLPCYKPNIKLQTCKMFKCKKQQQQQLTIIKRRGTKWITKRTNKSKMNKAWRHGIQLDVK